MAEIQFQDIADFDAERAQLARRRKLAESLIGQQLNTGVPADRMVSGRYVAPGVGEMMNAFVSPEIGRIQAQQLDQREQQLSQQEREAQAGLLNSIPQSGPERQQALLMAGQRMPSLRNSISALLAADERARENELNRIDKGEQLAADRVSKAESDEKYRRTFEQSMALKQAPTIHVSTGGGRSGGIKAPSGYRYNEDGTALEPIPGGPADKSNATKPLTQKQLETQRGFMDLDSSIANYEQLLNSYDPRGTAAADPATRAALEGAYTDLQMKLKTLYELGAPQAGDLKLLSQALPSPVDLEGTLRGAAFGSEPFKAKLKETKKLLNSSRANFETQLGKDTPTAAKPPALPEQRVTVRSPAEWQALEPGTPYVTADGKKGVR